MPGRKQPIATSRQKPRRRASSAKPSSSGGAAKGARRSAASAGVAPSASTTPRSTAEPDRRVMAYRRMAAQPAKTLRLFERIAEAWQLSRAERMSLLAVDGKTRYARWKRDPDSAQLTIQRAERIAQVIAIAEHLYTVHAGAPDAAESWPRRANTGDTYGGRAPIELMTSGPTEALIATRCHLAGWARR